MATIRLQFKTSFVVFIPVLLVACSTSLERESITSPAPIKLPENQPQVSAYKTLGSSGDASSQKSFRKLRLSAVGDIMMDGRARPYLQAVGYDAAFVGVRRVLSETQVLVGNLEGPLTEHDDVFVEKKYTFRSPPDLVAEALANANFSVVSLANNHTLDYGPQGLSDTITALDRVKILHVGAGANLAAARTPAIKDISGYRIGFLGYSNTFPEEFWAGKSLPGTAFGHAHQIKQDVQALKQLTDIVVVNFHWGREGKTELRPYQPILAHTAIDAGASVVVGHHPHVLQAVEYYKHGIIFYSLGNFVFGSFSPKAKVSAIAHVDFVDAEIEAISLTPISVDNFKVYFQPKVLVDTDAEAVFAELERLSAERATELAFENDRIVLRPSPLLLAEPNKQ